MLSGFELYPRWVPLTVNKLYVSATIAFSEKVMHMRQTAKQKLFS